MGLSHNTTADGDIVALDPDRSLVYAETNDVTRGITYSVGGKLQSTLHIPAGVTELAGTILMGSHSAIEFDPGAVIKASGTHQHTLIRTGNAEFDSANATTIPGVSIYCADEQDAGTGSLRYTHATTSLAWRAPGSAAYGAEVSVAGIVTASVAIFKIPSDVPGKSIYCYVGPQSLRTADIERSVIVASVTGAVPVSWTRTSNVRTVVEAAHDRKCGDFVILFSDGNIIHGYITSVTANSYTLPDAGADVTATVGTAYGVRNIRINGNGARLDYNKSGLATATTSNLHCTIFSACSDVEVRNLEVSNATKYAALVTGYKSAKFVGFRSYRTTSSDLSQNSDTIHVLGPGVSFDAEDCRAQGGDNILGVGCADYQDYVLNSPQYGSLSLVVGEVRNVRGEDTDQQPVRFYNANGSNQIQQWSVDGVHGTYNSATDAAVAIISDVSAQMVDAGATNVVGLAVKNITAARSDASASAAVVSRGTGTRSGINIADVPARLVDGTSRGVISLESPALDVTVDAPGAGTHNGPYINLKSGATVAALAVNVPAATLNNGGTGERPCFVRLDHATAAVDMLAVDVGGATDTSSSGSKACMVVSGGNVKRARLSGVSISNFDAAYRASSGATAGAEITLGIANMGADYGIASDVPVAGANAAHTDHSSGSGALFQLVSSGDTRINAVQCRARNRFIRNVSGSGNYYIRASGVEVGVTTIQTDAGTPSYRLMGESDLALDGTILSATITHHAPGATFYNTNAAFGAGIGKYARGASAWTRIAA